MSNLSRTACSLAPAYFHHWRSNSRISLSRVDRAISPADCSWLTDSAASIGLDPFTAWLPEGSALILDAESHACHSIPGESLTARRPSGTTTAHRTLIAILWTRTTATAKIYPGR